MSTRAWERGREGEREGDRKSGREGEREGGTEAGRKGEREEGWERKEERERGQQGERERFMHCCRIDDSKVIFSHLQYSQCLVKDRLGVCSIIGNWERGVAKMGLKQQVCF